MTLTNTSTKSQCAQILKHLQDGNTLTSLEAIFKFGCMRLGSRIYDLREAGHMIIGEMVKDENTGKKYSRYRMEV